MIHVKHIASRAEIPAGQPYVLVTYGEKLSDKSDARGHVITVPHGASMAQSQLSFTAAIHAARKVAKHEEITVVCACEN